MFAAVALLSSVSAAAAQERAFAVYDNMFFIGKPSTAPSGLVASNIIYGREIWPGGKNYGTLPNRAEFAAVVAAHKAGSGPIVLDIERMPLAGDRRTVAQRLSVLATLADWTREIAPGRIVGYFGYNTLTDVKPEFRDYAQALARHVNAFFPQLYTDDDDRAAFARQADAEIREARGFGKDKPIYFYLWPQYNAHTPKQFRWISRDYWRFQLETCYRKADGIVLWSPQRFRWDVSSGWWSEIVSFVHRLPHGARKLKGPSIAGQTLD
jgi:hypothetical protein